MSEGKTSWWQRLKGGLSRSSGQLTGQIAAILTKRRLDQETLDELEDALITADLGVEVAALLVAQLKRDRFGKDVTDIEIREALAAQIAAILTPVAAALPHRERYRPQVVLICGVNGTGKTTTVGKLANQARQAGLGVTLAACDTFRAAAVEQLQIWGQRNDVPVLTARAGADAAGLAFEALEQAQAQASELLLIDTAGRLHNKTALMDELRKIVRVLKKLDPDAPHDNVLVLDATTGQNALRQVETFKELVDVTGLIVTKLDGTAKGGVVVALARRFGLPVHAIGVGEGIEDLRSFEPESFARALLGLDEKRG